MGRATSAILKGFDNLNDQITVIATTNLFKHFDKALSRRFDLIVDFNRYTQEDLQEIAESILNNFLSKYKIGYRNTRLFRKILDLQKKKPCPSEMKKILRNAVCFCDETIEGDYLGRVYELLTGGTTGNLHRLHEQGFTVREIEILSGVSKSQVARFLNTPQQTAGTSKPYKNGIPQRNRRNLYAKRLDEINLAEVYKKGEEEVVWGQGKPNLHY